MIRLHRWLVLIAATALVAGAFALACSPPRWQHQPPQPVTSSSTRAPAQPVADPPGDAGIVKSVGIAQTSDGGFPLPPDGPIAPRRMPESARVDPSLLPPPPSASTGADTPLHDVMRASTPPADAGVDAALPPVPDGGLVRDAGTPMPPTAVNEPGVPYVQ